MRVLIVGGQGFIGSTLASELASKGHFVSIAGRNPTENLDLGIAEVIHWDATKEWSISTPRFDVVVHLASSNGAENLNSLDTYTNNLAVTRNVIDLCSRVRNASLLYVSTFQVLGRWSGVINDQTPAQPTTEYGFCHLVAEEHAKMFARNYARKLFIARPTNIVGVSANANAIRWDTVPAEFCRQAIVDRRIRIQSTGMQHRDFLSVQDAARRLASLLSVRDFWDSNPRLVGSGTSVAVMSVAEMVTDSLKRLFGRQIDVQRRHGEQGIIGTASELNLAYSTFRKVDLVAAATSKLQHTVDELVLRAEEVFNGRSKQIRD